MTFKTTPLLLQETPPHNPSSARQTLKVIARANRGKLAFTLGLVGLENALLLAYPLFAGFAVDAILRGEASSALFYALVVLTFWVVGALRRSIDTRTFTRIYADLVVPVILNQRLRQQSTSIAAARAMLAREFVDFFEKHVPTMGTALASIVGAAVMLLVIEPWIGMACLGALLACLGLMPRFARRNEVLHGRLNDHLEKEIGLVEKVGAATLLRHYRALSKLRIWLSDREALAFLFIGTLAALLFAVAIVQLAMLQKPSAGHVYSVMTYLWIFVENLDEAPGVLSQLARLKDIGQRVGTGSAPTADRSQASVDGTGS